MKKLLFIISLFTATVPVLSQRYTQIGSEIYNHVGKFQNGLSPVNKEYKAPYGYVNTSGKLVVKHKYEYAEDFSDGMAAVKDKEKWGFINSSGDLAVKIKFEKVADFSSGLAPASLDGDKFGFIDKRGDWVIQPQFGRAFRFSEDIAVVTEGYSNFRFIRKDGSFLNNATYDLVENFHNGMAMVKSRGRVGYINKNGQQVVDFKYSEAKDFSDGMGVVKLGGMYGAVNSSGTEVIAPTYDYISEFSDGVAVARKTEEGDPIVIDKSGREVFTNTQYTEINPYFQGSAVAKTKDDMYVLIDKRGNQLAGTKFGLLGGIFVFDYEDKSKVYFRKGGLYGFMNRQGKIIIQPKYQSVNAFVNGYASVSIGDRYVIIDENGNQL